jgi:hypothetical protein
MVRRKNKQPITGKAVTGRLVINKNLLLPILAFDYWTKNCRLFKIS